MAVPSPPAWKLLRRERSCITYQFSETAPGVPIGAAVRRRVPTPNPSHPLASVAECPRGRPLPTAPRLTNLEPRSIADPPTSSHLPGMPSLSICTAACLAALFSAASPPDYIGRENQLKV